MCDSKVLHTDTERTHAGTLRVDLVYIRHASRERVRRDLVAILVPELRCFCARTHYLGAGIGCILPSRSVWFGADKFTQSTRTNQTSHDTANGRSDTEEMGDGGSIEELVLEERVSLGGAGRVIQRDVRGLSSG